MTKTDWQKAVERARRRREQQQRDGALRARFVNESFVRRFRSARKSLASLIDLVDDWTRNYAHLELAQEGSLHAAYVTADREIPEESDEHFTHCIESLRASLDQLAFMLSESNTGRLTEQQERDSSFPIHRTLVHANDKRGWKGISLMSARAAGAIKSLQPARAFPEDPQTSPLFLLADLAERSKHRTGLVAATAVAPSFTAGNGILDYLEFNSPSIVPGERNMIYRIGGRVPERTVMSIDIVTRISVSGSVADGMHLTSTLTGIANYIDRVVFPKLMRTV